MKSAIEYALNNEYITLFKGENMSNPAGSKMIKKAKKHSIGLRFGAGGIVSAAIREMSKDKYLAKQANKD